ncbi:MAG: ATP-dependent Clp protease ATP-binding subunit [Anaerolineae bacterium]|nr:ATP-dependent Clp protease ATP-binding subunit [Anaerolineae bacterium]
MEGSRWDQLTPEAEQVLMIAEEAAMQMRHLYVGTEHLLLGLVQEEHGEASRVLRKMGLDPHSVRRSIQRLSPEERRPSPGRPQLTSSTKRVIHIALQEARKRGDVKIDTHHILLALIQEHGGIADVVLRDLGINANHLQNEVLLALQRQSQPIAAPRQSRFRREKTGTPMVDRMAIDLTALAVEGSLDPVIGREKEIERVIQVLARRTKNNPALIGEPGVGKTAIVEGLTQRIVEGNAPSILLEKRVLQLDLGSLVAGTMYRGQFEERLKKVIDEVKQSDTILFIDEMHMMVGAGSAGSSMDVANILKPALARGELQCIGATTLDEYRRHIEPDAALERRFQPIAVEEPSVADTIEILRGLVAVYEAHHHLQITDAALQSAAQLAHRYISDRFLPDKAIDVIDEAASRVRMYKSPQAVRIRAAYAERKTLEERAREAAGGHPLDAALLQEQVTALTKEIETLRENWDSDAGVVVGPEDVAEIVSMWTGIPLAQLTMEQMERLLQMEEVLKARIVGQDEAIASISRAVRRARAGLKDPRRPIGSFIFLGPTGVGKTELTKALAAFLFGSEDALLQFDMSEFMERHTAARLVGAPPGYIGYDDAGQLTEAVRRRPFSIVVFDEIEKAHPEVFNMLLQVMEEGYLSDAKGRRVDFRNTIVIMTSNVGAEAIRRSGLGFGLAETEAAEGAYDEMSRRLKEELKRLFRPEFLNRVDSVVVFRALGPAEIARIVDLEIAKVVERVQEQAVTLDVAPAARSWLAEKGYSQEYGARPLRRVIQNNVEDALSDVLLSGKFEPGDTVQVDVEGDEIVLR